MEKATVLTRPYKPAPSWSFLEGAVGRQVLDAYQARVEARGGPAARDILKMDSNVVTGSNPFAVVLIEDILREQFPGTHVATPADLERALQSPSGAKLQEHYVDMGIVARGTHEELNQYLAQHIAGQLPKKSKFPVMILLTDLTLVVDEKSPPGVAFSLREGTKPIYAPQFALKNDGKRFSKTDKNGLPIWASKGTRTNYTSDDPLSVLSLTWCADLFSGRYYLEESNSNGRVVVTSGGAARRKD